MKNENSERNRRILVIDDNASIHADFKKVLGPHDTDGSALVRAEAELFGETPPAPREKPSFDLASAFQGQEGLKMVREAVEAGRPYAMAFVDVRMPPGWDGVETVGRLWEVDPDLQIVICTAYSDYSLEEMMTRLGTTDRLVILKKPFDTIEALQLANALTEKWYLLQQAKAKLQDLERLVGERTAALQKENAERLMTERALRDTQDKLQHFLSKSPAVLYSFRFESGSWLPAWVSDNYLKFTGYEVQDWYRHSPALPCVEAPDRERILASFEALLVKSQVSLQYQVHRKDHTVRWLRDDRQLFRDPDGRPAEIIGCWTDITDQRLLEEELRQSQKMESVGLLAGGIAHDFNNMLTVMRCHVDLLARSGTFAGDASESLRAIQASADRSANLTRQLLAFSRKQIMRPENLDLNELAGSLSKLLARTLGEDIAMNADYTPHLPEVYADCGMIEQVILNLAINARDAMPKGGQLKLSTSVREIDEAQAKQHPESRAGRFVCLSVTDSGAGIAPDHLAHIFEPFFTTKQVGKGTGLGLATVYGIVKQHEGWIEVESSLGQGTTFRILLPVSNQKTENTVTKIPVPASRGGSETILVVEDEPALLNLVRVTLQRQGYRVFTAGSGLEALENWSERLQQIDLLLTDMVMPDGVTGVELAERLLAQKPELKTIYMSGYSADLNGQEAVVSKDVCFLPKPFGPQALTKLVRECLDGHKRANLLTHSTRTATGSRP